MPQSLEFKALPLVEAGARLAFSSPMEAIRFEQGVALANHFGAEFPVISASEARELPPGRSEPQFEFVAGGVIPGLEFVKPDSGLSAVLQNDLLMIRWQKLRPEVEYPRFGAITQLLQRFVSDLERVSAPVPAASAVNFSYLNFIADADSQGPALLKRLIRIPFGSPGLGGVERFVDANISWGVTGGLDRRVHIQQATRTMKDASTPGYLLRTVVGKRLVVSAPVMSALQEVHDDLQLLFFEIITEAALKEWGYVTNPIR